MRRPVLLCTAAIALGSMIYICFRPGSLAVFAWAEAVGLEQAVGALRQLCAPIGPHVPEPVIHSLPGALWAGAFALAMGTIWRATPIRRAWPYLSTVPALALGSEVGQGLSLLPGTFDPIDLIAYTAGITLGFMVALRGSRTEPL
jgi:glycopeptide antibiotics resistance protein